MGTFTGPATRGLGGRKIFSRNTVEPTAPPIGNQVIFQIETANNSSGPYLVPNNTSLIDGVTRAPIPSPLGIAPLGVLVPDPVIVNGLSMQVVGVVGIGPTWYYTVCLLGTVPQNHFTDMSFETVSDGPVTLLSADADFNGLFTGVGFSIWAWEMPGGGIPQDFMANDSDITITWP